MKFVFNYTRVTNRAESIVVGSLIISSSLNHELVVVIRSFKSFLDYKISSYLEKDLVKF